MKESITGRFIQRLDNRQLLSCTGLGTNCGLDLDQLLGGFCEANGTCFVQQNAINPQFNSTNGQFCIIISGGDCVNAGTEGTPTLQAITGPVAVVTPTIAGVTGAYSIVFPDNWPASLGSSLVWYYLADQGATFTGPDTGGQSGGLVDCLSLVQAGKTQAFRFFSLGLGGAIWETNLGCVGVPQITGSGVYEGCYDGYSFIEFAVYGSFGFMGNFFSGFGNLPTVFSMNAVNNTSGGNGNTAIEYGAIGYSIDGQTVGCVNDQGESILGTTILTLSALNGPLSLYVEGEITGPNFGFLVYNPLNNSMVVEMGGKNAELVFTAFNSTYVNFNNNEVDYTFTLNGYSSTDYGISIETDSAIFTSWPNVLFEVGKKTYGQGGYINGDYALVPNT